MIFEVNNIQYRGFIKIAVLSSIETLSDAFEITCVNRWIGDAAPIKAGDPCRILDDNETELLNGYVDTLGLSIGGNITISGRDKAGDLIDCTVDGVGEFAGLTLKQIITRIASPFDIGVSGEDGATVQRFRHGLDERASSVIRELVTRQGFLCNSDGSGNLVIEKAGNTRASFVVQEGVNTLAGSATVSAARQRSNYTVRGQSAASNTPVGVYAGKSTRHRPLSSLNTGDIEIADSRSASEWLARVMDGSATIYSVDVADIQSVSKNTLIECAAPSLGIAGDLLIRSVTRIVDSRGSRTRLDLVNPHTFGLDYVVNNFLD